MPNALPKMVEERIVSFSLAHPGLGPQRVAAELAREKWGGLRVSKNGICSLPRRRRRALAEPIVVLPPMNRCREGAVNKSLEGALRAHHNEQPLQSLDPVVGTWTLEPILPAHLRPTFGAT